MYFNDSFIGIVLYFAKIRQCLFVAGYSLFIHKYVDFDVFKKMLFPVPPVHWRVSDAGPFLRVREVSRQEQIIQDGRETRANCPGLSVVKGAAFKRKAAPLVLLCTAVYSAVQDTPGKYLSAKGTWGTWKLFPLR